MPDANRPAPAEAEEWSICDRNSASPEREAHIVMYRVGSRWYEYVTIHEEREAERLTRALRTA